MDINTISFIATQATKYITAVVQEMEVGSCDVIIKLSVTVVYTTVC